MQGAHRSQAKLGEGKRGEAGIDTLTTERMLETDSTGVRVRTMIVLPMNLSKWHERPTSRPEPSGLNSRKSFSTLCVAAFLLVPSITGLRAGADGKGYGTLAGNGG